MVDMKDLSFILMYNALRMLLPDIIERKGVDTFLKCEENALISIKKENTVIATGGSAVYSMAAMDFLRQNGVIIYLKVEKDELLRRLKDVKERGGRYGETIDEMFETRSELYESYADVVVYENDNTIEETVRMTVDVIK